MSDETRSDLKRIELTGRLLESSAEEDINTLMKKYNKYLKELSEEHKDECNKDMYFQYDSNRECVL